MSIWCIISYTIFMGMLVRMFLKSFKHNYRLMLYKQGLKALKDFREDKSEFNDGKGCAIEEIVAESNRCFVKGAWKEYNDIVTEFLKVLETDKAETIDIDKFLKERVKF